MTYKQKNALFYGTILQYINSILFKNQEITVDYNLDLPYDHSSDNNSSDINISENNTELKTDDYSSDGNSSNSRFSENSIKSETVSLCKQLGQQNFWQQSLWKYD